VVRHLQAVPIDMSSSRQAAEKVCGPRMRKKVGPGPQTQMFPEQMQMQEESQEPNGTQVEICNISALQSYSAQSRLGLACGSH
jgi:hypothetical protein